jgi:hypothetical protein
LNDTCREVGILILPRLYGPLHLLKNEARHLKEALSEAFQLCDKTLRHNRKCSRARQRGRSRRCSFTDRSRSRLVGGERRAWLARLEGATDSPTGVESPGATSGTGALGRYAREVSSTTGLRTCRYVLTDPVAFCALVGFLIVAGLGLDRFATLGWQHVLGACTWAVLLGACAFLGTEERATVAVVVVVATLAEIIGSIIWKVYEYRMGNLPVFVPAGHGLVYLSGLRITQMDAVRRHPARLIGLAVGGALLWAVLGLTVLGRTDVAGAMGVATLVGFILWGRAPLLYSGVFLTVAILEIYGTWVGTWKWAAQIPGLGLRDGNPPSGAASGYILFDISALVLAPVLLAAIRGLRGVRASTSRASVEGDLS